MEDESAGEGNYWASLKESLPGGERLTHIEVGLEGEAEVQGLGEGIGEISFFLPDEEGTEEVAQQVQQLLQGDSGTSGAGVSGMQMEGLDWANVEVMLLEDSTSEEQEALLVIPAQDTSGQRLWGRSRPPIDGDQALYVKVRVKKTVPVGSTRPQLQVVRPTPERPAVKPVVKRGVELKPAFQYCPFRYYGRLSSFRRVLCRDSWGQWYRKQWKSGAVSAKVFEGYNLAVRKGAYGIVATWDRKRPFDLLVAGLPRLDQNKVQEIWEVAIRVLSGTSGGLDPRLQQFLQTLGDSISKVDRWMQLLSEAIKQGRFEEEYSRLLAEGLDKLEQALLGLLNSGERGQAKDLIRKVASQWPTAKPIPLMAGLAQETAQQILEIQNETREFLRTVYFYAQLAWDLCSKVPVVQDICEPLQELIEHLSTWLGVIPCGSPYDCIDAFIQTWNQAAIMIFDVFGGGEALTFSQAIRDLLINTWNSRGCIRLPTGDCFMDFDSDWKSLWGLIGWMANSQVQPEEARHRSERGYSTILIAANSINQPGNTSEGPWLFQGFVKTFYPYGTWWGVVLAYYPNVLIAPGAPHPKVVAVAAGDHCQDCARKASEIVEWVRTALGILPGQLRRDQMTGSFIDYGLIT